MWIDTYLFVSTFICVGACAECMCNTMCVYCLRVCKHEQHVLKIPCVHVYECSVYVSKRAHGSAEVWCGSRADLVLREFGSAWKENTERWMGWLVAVCQHATLKRQERKDMRKERRTGLISNGRRIINGVNTVSLKQRYVENGILWDLAFLSSTYSCEYKFKVCCNCSGVDANNNNKKHVSWN